MAVSVPGGCAKGAHGSGIPQFALMGMAQAGEFKTENLTFVMRSMIFPCVSYS
jgi:hypothetical protein